MGWYDLVCLVCLVFFILFYVSFNDELCSKYEGGWKVISY